MTKKSLAFFNIGIRVEIDMHVLRLSKIIPFFFTNVTNVVISEASLSVLEFAVTSDSFGTNINIASVLFCFSFYLNIIMNGEFKVFFFK